MQVLPPINNHVGASIRPIYTHGRPVLPPINNQVGASIRPIYTHGYPIPGSIPMTQLQPGSITRISSPVIAPVIRPPSLIQVNGYVGAPIGMI